MLLISHIAAVFQLLFVNLYLLVEFAYDLNKLNLYLFHPS